MSGGGGLGQAVGVKPQLDSHLVLLDGSVLGVPLDGGVLGVPLDGSVLGVGEEGTDGANAGDKVRVQPFIFICLRKHLQCKLCNWSMSANVWLRWIVNCSIVLYAYKALHLYILFIVLMVSAVNSFMYTQSLLLN